MSGKLLESTSLAPITNSQHKIVRVCEIFGKIYDVLRIFLCREKEATSTIFKVLYALCKKNSSPSTCVYQSTQENARERERERGGGNIQETSITWARCFSAHVWEFAKFDEMISVENWAKLSRAARDLQRGTESRLL